MQYTPRVMMLVCTKANGGAFMKGQAYEADMDAYGNWSVTGVDGESYDLQRSMWGRLVYQGATEKFFFEPNDD